MRPTPDHRLLSNLASDAVTTSPALGFESLYIKSHDVNAEGELLPAVDWDLLPTMDVAGTFVSQHANPVDAMLVELGSQNSKRAYESRLAGVARLLPEPLEVRAVPWQNLRYVHVIAIKAALQDAGMSPTSINATLAAVRKIAKVCVRLKLMERDEVLNIRDVAMLRVHRLPAGREVRIGELEAIIRACP